MINDTIEKLKHHTSTHIKKSQEANIPIVYKLDLERRYSFDTHGFYHSHYREDSLLFVCHNLPLMINKTRHVYADGLENMVNKNEISPMLIFINGEFIKWSDIMIVVDHNYAYINILNNSEIFDPKCECILLPRNVSYTEKQTTIPDNSIFTFDDNGRCVTELMAGNRHYTNIIPSEGSNLFYENMIPKEGVKQETKIDTKFKITDSNFIIFRQGLLYSDASIEVHGLSVFSIDDNKFKGKSILCKALYFKKANVSLDNLTTPNNRNGLISNLKQSRVPEFVERLAKEFNFEFDKNLFYDENITKALVYIMGYNSSLMNDVIKKSSNIISKLYTGKELKDLADISGYVRLSRRINGVNDNYPMIFKNGLLYEGYCEIQYINKDFTIPILNIKDSDTIEILYFVNIDNTIVPLYLPSGDSDIHIFDPSIKIENMKLYTTNPESSTFNIERSDKVQYEIGFNSKRLSNDSIDIRLHDSFHYDKRLSLASNRQFRYLCSVAKEDTIDIPLYDDFRFCSDKNRYIVFINGRKIDNSNFKITIAKTNRPFDDTSIYINIPLLKRDKIEVFYVSEKLTEVSVQPSIPQNGIVTINRDNIKYGLNSELYMVFINGIKMNVNQIQDISSSKIRITTSLKSIKNLCIVKHIEDNYIIGNIFRQHESLLDDIYSSMSDILLDSLFKDNSIFTNTDKDIKSTQVDDKSILYHIIQDYYMRPYINQGDVFEYDFETDEFFTETDSDDNRIVRSLDASRHDKLEE